jgi:hypothetical protein
MHVVSASSMADLKAAILGKWRYFLYINISDQNKISVSWSHFLP